VELPPYNGKSHLAGLRPNQSFGISHRSGLQIGDTADATLRDFLDTPPCSDEENLIDAFALVCNHFTVVCVRV
jgi:hypothetical protein